MNKARHIHNGPFNIKTKYEKLKKKQQKTKFLSEKIGKA